MFNFSRRSGRMATGVLALVAVASVTTLRLPGGVQFDGADSPTGDSTTVDSTTITPHAPALAADDALDAVSDLVSANLLEGDSRGYGDDPTLDRLWDGCAGGNGRACDKLFELAPIGSDYERFGLTCGDRPVVLDCHLELDG